MSKIIKLKYPVIKDSQTYNELVMRRSKVKDRLAIANMKNLTDEEKEIRLFSNLCEVTPEIIQELDETDYSAVQKVYIGFFDLKATSAEK